MKLLLSTKLILYVCQRSYETRSPKDAYCPDNGNRLGSIFTASWSTKMDQLIKNIHGHKDLIEDDAKALAISEGVAAQAGAYVGFYLKDHGQPRILTSITTDAQYRGSSPSV